MDSRLLSRRDRAQVRRRALRGHGQARDPARGREQLARGHSGRDLGHPALRRNPAALPRRNRPRREAPIHHGRALDLGILGLCRRRASPRRVAVAGNVGAACRLLRACRGRHQVGVAAQAGLRHAVDIRRAVAVARVARPAGLVRTRQRNARHRGADRLLDRFNLAVPPAAARLTHHQETPWHH